jgi:hypothetical protein
VAFYVGIYADIEPTHASVRDSTMRVPMQHKCALATLVPRQQRVMTHNNCMALNCLCMQVGQNLVEQFLQRWFCADQFVVIAEHQSLHPMKPMHDAASRGDITEEHITEHIHNIVVLDTRVPVFNESIVHLGDAVERALTIIDYIGVPEMQVRREEDVHYSSPQEAEALLAIVPTMPQPVVPAREAEDLLWPPN